jgi:DNA-binding transcriptional MerR regulator
MSKYLTIGEVASQSGISLRTLRHYDAIGLLVPAIRGDNNYRYYQQSDLERLYQILMFRALGFSLREVSDLLEMNQSERVEQLRAQRDILSADITRLQQMREQLDTLIEEKEMMGNPELFSIFDGFDPDEFADEASERWGDTEAYRESARRSRQYSQEDWQRFKQESDALNSAMVDCLKQGLQADDSRVLDIIEQMRLQIDQWFYPCSRAMHASLGEMYVMDARFTATYEKLHPGMAQFMRDATAANLAR